MGSMEINDEHQKKRMRSDDSSACSITDLIAVEIERNKLVNELRHIYKSKLSNALGVDEPRESFNRWIFSRPLEHGGSCRVSLDALIPSLPTGVHSASTKKHSERLFQEVLDDIPIKLPYMANRSDRHRYLSSLLTFLTEAPAHFSNTDFNSQQTFKLEQARSEVSVLASAAETPTYEEVKELKMRVQDVIKELVASTLSDLLVEFENEAHQRAEALAAMLKQKSDFSFTKSRIETLGSGDDDDVSMTKESTGGSSERDGTKTVVSNGVSVGNGKVADTDYTILTFQKPDKIWMISCAADDKFTFELSNQIYEKLQRRFAFIQKTEPQKPAASFEQALFLVLLRYRTAMGSASANEGIGLHASIPSDFAYLLERKFPHDEQCFANPFNSGHHFKFCSAFADVDRFFGGDKEFFSFRPKQGRYQCNPPFDAFLIEKMYDHIDGLLKDAVGQDGSLSFIVNIPAWNSEVNKKCKASKFLKLHVLLPRGKHVYDVGHHAGEVIQKDSVCDTDFYFLATESSQGGAQVRDQMGCEMWSKHAPDLIQEYFSDDVQTSLDMDDWA